MQKILFGIFAHPDDEAFGPCGTLLGETRQGTELHLITLTAGEHGANPDNVEDLGETRLQEWKKGAALLGASSSHYLGYEDGTLGNDNHLEITHKIEALVKTVVQDREDIIVEFICFDLNGLTGHIDHIVASRSACLAFYRLREAGQPLARIRLACLASQDYPLADTGFVFMQPGRSESEIDEIIDSRTLLTEIQEIMRCHHTQRNDCETQISRLGERVAIDHFMILK